MDSGNAVESTSQDGGLSPCFSAGIALLNGGIMLASHVSIKHQSETEANCAIVRVTGLGKALRIDFEEVFVRAEVMYHIMQRV